jgi:hypothetical protein
MYASVSIGKFSTLSEASKALVSQSDTFTPTANLKDFYTLQHRKFVALRKAIQPSWYL